MVPVRKCLPDPHSQIRILRLQQAKDDRESIQIVTNILDLADEYAKYEALSYTWGTDDKDMRVYLDGDEFPVTENLHAALWRLRKLQHLTLWVDAVCIDQDNHQERSAQVSQMSTIFRRAQKVLVWVGEDSDVSDGRLSFQFLAGIDWHDLDQDMRRDMTRDTMYFGIFGTFGSLSSQQVNRHVQKVSFDLDIRISEHNATQQKQNSLTKEILNQFLARPWFSRRWVIQEVYVAREAMIICGSCTMPWLSLLAALNNADYDCYAKQNNVAMELSRTMTQAGDILSAMHRYQNMKCQDDRDLIGAIINLYPAVSYRVDYSLDVAANFINFASTLVDAGDYLILLESAGICQQGGTSRLSGAVPTWVPDWTRLQGGSIDDTARRRRARKRYQGILGRDEKDNSYINKRKKKRGFFKASVASQWVLVLDDVRVADLDDADLARNWHLEGLRHPHREWPGIIRPGEFLVQLHDGSTCVLEPVGERFRFVARSWSTKDRVRDSWNLTLAHDWWDVSTSWTGTIEII